MNWSHGCWKFVEGNVTCIASGNEGFGVHRDINKTGLHEVRNSKYLRRRFKGEWESCMNAWGAKELAILWGVLLWEWRDQVSRSVGPMAFPSALSPSASVPCTFIPSPRVLNPTLLSHLGSVHSLPHVPFDLCCLAPVPFLDPSSDSFPFLEPRLSPSDENHPSAWRNSSLHPSSRPLSAFTGSYSVVAWAMVFLWPCPLGWRWCLAGPWVNAN